MQYFGNKAVIPRLVVQNCGELSQCLSENDTNLILYKFDSTASSTAGSETLLLFVLWVYLINKSYLCHGTNYRAWNTRFWACAHVIEKLSWQKKAKTDFHVNYKTLMAFFWIPNLWMTDVVNPWVLFWLIAEAKLRSFFSNDYAWPEKKSFFSKPTFHPRPTIICPL